jgi:hypothetical protein
MWKRLSWNRTAQHLAERFPTFFGIEEEEPISGNYAPQVIFMDLHEFCDGYQLVIA